MFTIDNKMKLVSRDGLHEMISDYVAMFGRSTRYLNIMTLHDFLKNRNTHGDTDDGLHRLCNFVVSDMKDVDLLDQYAFLVTKCRSKRKTLSQLYYDAGVD